MSCVSVIDQFTKRFNEYSLCDCRMVRHILPYVNRYCLYMLTEHKNIGYAQCVAGTRLLGKNPTQRYSTKWIMTPR